MTVAWWVAVAALFAGAILGGLMMAVIVAADMADEIIERERGMRGE